VAKWNRWGTITVGIFTVIGSIAAVVAIFHSSSGSKDTTSAYSFTDPVPSQIPDKPCRFVAYGTGSPPPGQDLVIASQEEGGGGRLFFEADVQKDAQRRTWSVTLVIGEDATRPGTLFHLYAVQMNSDIERYLSTVTDKPGATYWSSPGWPPSSKQVATAEVRRTKSKCT
jgi:hypothetical protein